MTPDARRPGSYEVIPGQDGLPTPATGPSHNGGYSLPPGNVLSSTINLLNTLVGAGMLALPYALSVQGFVIGLTTLILAALGSIVGQQMLAECAYKLQSRTSSYGALAEAVLPRCLVLIDLAVSVKCFGVATSYFLVIGDQLPEVARYAFELDGFLTQREVWILLAGLMVCPLVSFSRLDSLKFTSAIALLGATYLAGIVCAYAWISALNDELPCKQPEADPSCVPPPELLKMNWDMLKVLPIFVFSFTCHQNIFLVHNELRDNSTKFTSRAILTAVATALCLYALVATSGYATFGDMVRPDILLMYPFNGAVTVCRVAIAVLVLFSYPLQIAPCRQHLLHLAEWAGPATARRHSDLLFMIVTAGLVLGSTVLALNVTSLGLVLSVVGATASTTLGYVLPGAFHFKMFYEDKRIGRSVAAGAMCALGFVIMFVALFAIFYFHASA